MQYPNGDIKQNKKIYPETLTVTEVYGDGAEINCYGIIGVTLILKGSGMLRIFGQSVPCAENEIYIVSENIPHGFFVSEEGNELKLKTLRFRACDWFDGDAAIEGSANYCHGVFSDGSSLSYALLTRSVATETEALMDYTVREAGERLLEWRCAVGAYLSLLFVTVARYVGTTIKNLPELPMREKADVTSVIRIIEERCGEAELTLDAVAASLYVSPSYLSRVFRRYMGQAFSDFLRSYRMDRACRLLAETDISVSDVVSRCGLRDIPSFYRSFSRYKGTTPNQYRSLVRKSETGIKNTGDSKMSILNEISENLQIGKAKIVKELVQKALDEGLDAKTILEEGLISGMNVIGEKFKNNEIYIPEVLVAARALNMGTQILKPHFGAAGVEPVGRVCIGTVEGDLHDIGKNLVKMMMEGKQLEVVDLGTDVPAETFVKTAIEQNCRIICCSALLTTTMGVMQQVVEAATAAGIRDKVKIMIGGAPVNEEFCKKIGADVYTVDAASAADAALELCKAMNS